MKRSVLLTLTVFSAFPALVFSTKNDVVAKFNFTRVNKEEFNTNKTFKCIDKVCWVTTFPNATSSPLYALVMVLSAPKNFEQRKRFRDMEWLSPRFQKTRGGVKTVFILGSVQNKKLQKAIEKESAKYRDILQISHPDGYKNLPYKSITGFLWASQNYNPRYIIKADDDIVLHGHNWFKVMEEKFPFNTTPDPDTIHCLPCKHARPSRLFEGVNSRYGVPVEVYPHSQFPEFCLGWIYILTPSLAEKLGMAASGTPYMNIDDVYVTGLVRSNVENTKVDYLTQGRIQRWVSNVLAEIVEDSCMYQILLSNDIATCNDDMRFRVLLGQLVRFGIII